MSTSSRCWSSSLILCAPEAKRRRWPSERGRRPRARVASQGDGLDSPPRCLLRVVIVSGAAQQEKERLARQYAWMPCHGEGRSHAWLQVRGWIAFLAWSGSIRPPRDEPTAPHQGNAGCRRESIHVHLLASEEQQPVE